MTETEFATTVTALVGIIVAAMTGVFGYQTARWSLRRDLEIELRRQRQEALRELWSISEPLARYGRGEAVTEVTPSSMERLSRELRHWYFHQGGMFLSERSQRYYIALQEAIGESLRNVPGTRDGPLWPHPPWRRKPKPNDIEFDDGARESLMQASSELRSQIRASFKGFPKM